MAAPGKGMMIHMGRKILSILIAIMLLFSCATSVFAAEGEAHTEPHSHSESAHPMEPHSHGETEYPIEPHDHSHDHPHDHDYNHNHAHDDDCDHDHTHDDDCDHDHAHDDVKTGDVSDGEAPAPHPDEEVTEPELPETPPEDETPTSLPDEEETEPELPEVPPEQQEIPDYIVLETKSGAAIVMFGTPNELTEPIITPFLVGSRPCAFHECPNTVTVHTKYDFVCNSHKCSISGCSSPAYYMNPNKCQVHAGLTNIICQIYTPENPDNLCGKPSVGNGSICCWEHHCPGCFGIGSGNATICNICRQCWVPGCPNYSTCTNECNDHCPHTCKTHHQNHCLDCHNDPCICFPANPAINVRAWNNTDNSVSVDISSVRATEIELYTAGGVKFATLGGTSGTHIFRYNAAQNNGSYYVRVKNAKGYNSGSFPFFVSTLDVAAPVITKKTVHPDGSVWAASKTLAVTASDKTNATFSLRYADGSPVPGCPDKAGTANGSTFTVTWTITEQIAGPKNFRIMASDRWGYSSDTTVSVSGIDSIKPSKPLVSLSDSGDWQRQDVTVTISGSSADSGIACYQYRIDGGAWQTGSVVQITAEGIHTVEARAVSGAGLESDVASTVVKIDKTAPTASYILSPEGWTTESVTITLNPTDTGGSGLACVMLPTGEAVYEFGNIQLSVAQNGDYHFTLMDNAGNSSAVVVPVTNIAMLDVTVTLNAPFVISPDNDRLYAGEMLFQNHSNVPVNLTLQRMTAYGDSPELVGRDDKVWKSLSTADTKRYIALGFAGNGVNFWVDGQPQALGTIAKGGLASYSMQGRFGHAWERAESFLYGMTVKIAIAPQG